MSYKIISLLQGQIKIKLTPHQYTDNFSYFILMSHSTNLRVIAAPRLLRLAVDRHPASWVDYDMNLLPGLLETPEFRKLILGAHKKEPKNRNKALPEHYFFRTLNLH